MEGNSSILLEELHYHRVFMRTDRRPSALDIEPIVGTCEVLIFILDSFSYALFIRGIEGWISPLESGEIQLNGTIKRHFNFDIGTAITHECAIQESLQIAQENGFDKDTFLDLPATEVMSYIQRFIELILVKTRPVNISFINALAFSCTLCGILAEKYKLDYVTHIASTAASIFEMYFPYEWIYFDFKHWAFVYILRHKQIHD